LRRNDDYLKCCDAEGKGKLATLYAAFGDVRKDDFAGWWGRSKQKGAYLFAEQQVDLKLQRLVTKADWPQEWEGNDEVMVVAVNMTIGRRKLQSYFAKLLQEEHKGKRGRRAMGTAKSTARYKLHRNYTVHNLKVMLATYDAWRANRLLPTEERQPLWAIGESIKLVRTAMPERGDDKYDITAKHNVMAVAVSRYVRQAKAIIANTALGIFPKSAL